MNTELRTLILISIFLVCTTNGIAQDSETLKSPLAKLELKSGDTIVFLGDGITAQCLYTQYVEDFFYTRYPNRKLKIHNAGLHEATTNDALNLYKFDVATHDPKYVMILLGMQDGEFVQFDQALFDRYVDDMEKLIGTVTTTPILLTPTMYDSRAKRAVSRDPLRNRTNRQRYNSVLAYYGSWLREKAVENGYGFVDMHGPLNKMTFEQRKGRNDRPSNPNFTLIKDGIHPDPAGHVVMALAIIEDLGLNAPLSNIRLEPAAGGKFKEKTPKSSGGVLKILESTRNSIEFTWTADSLPWVLPEEAELGVQLTKLARRASRETLEIDGLPIGDYELSISETVVGRYDNTQFARGIELQSKTQTPQYRQALEVAELNEERNEHIKKIRMAWKEFQAQARKNETDANLGELAKTAQEETQTNQTAAEKLEAEIRTKNGPQPQTYVITRISSDSPVVQVVGKITMDGKPLANATLEFHSAQGNMDAAITDEAGLFSLTSEKLPRGAYTLTVSKEGVDVGRYSSPDTSTLKYNIAPGKSQISIDLTTD